MRRGIAVILIALAPVVIGAQGRGRGAGNQAPGAAAGGAQAAAPIDITGYWVSMITDDWRYRMLTPPKGNIDYLPVNAEGRKVADSWDPAKDEAAGEQCRAYGAVGVMRLPGRLHVTWESGNVLKLDADAGTQTRRFVFGDAPPAAAEPTWQGQSAARWTYPGAGRGRGQPSTGELRVTTTRMRPGYIRKNGVPYSGNATLTEYFVRLIDDDEQQYLALTQMLEDPQYLLQPIIRTMLFKKQADAAQWNPTACSAR
jgi:hypothetical protein